MVIRNTILAMGVILSSTACVTSQSSDVSRQADNIHVHQTSGEDVLTELNRNHWVSIRNSTGSDDMKLYSALGTREWDIAIQDARTHLRQKPKSLAALQVLSVALAMKQNYSLSAYYGRLIEKYYPGQVDTNNIQGLAILNQPGASYRDFRKALGKFESSFEANPKQIASGLNLGHLHMEMGNFDSAVDVFSTVRDRCNQCTTAILGRGIAASRKKDFSLAKESFESVLKLKPNDLQAKYYLAVIENFGFHDKKKAVKLLADLLDDKSNRELAVKRKANFLMRRIEAQIYAQKSKRDIPLNEQISKEEELALENNDNSAQDLDSLGSDEELSSIETVSDEF